MRKSGRTVVLVVALGLPLWGQSQSAPRSTPDPPATPLYRITFKSKDPIAGIEASPALKLPFECTGDGTVFVTMVPLGGQLKPPLYTPPPLLLVSISPAGKATLFPLDQVTEQFYDVREIDHSVSQSGVVFLIKAAADSNPTKQTYSKSDGTQGEFTKNAAERHSYIVLFNRDGEHKKTIETDVSFEIQHIGLFPSGAYLAFGYDSKDHSPKMAMLKDDGTLMRMLQFGKAEVPESLLGTKDQSGKGPAVYFTPVQLMSAGHSIVLLQNKTSFPLLDVSETGEIRPIHPQLPKDSQVEGIIASDTNLYARVSPSNDGSIYELNAHDGAVLRRFKISDGRSGASVACVHDGMFLSFEHGNGKLVPLVGTAEPSTDVSSGK